MCSIQRRLVYCEDTQTSEQVNTSYSLRILQESLVGFLLSKVLQELLSVSQHRVHVSFVLHRQLQSPAETQAWAADTQARVEWTVSATARTCPSCRGWCVSGWRGNWGWPAVEWPRPPVRVHWRDACERDTSLSTAGPLWSWCTAPCQSTRGQSVKETETMMGDILSADSPFL